MENQEDIIESKGVVEMFTLASEYCLYLTRMDKETQADAFAFLQKMLPALYLKGSTCPAVEVSDESANERFVTEEEYEELRIRLSKFIDDKDMFTTVDLMSDDINSLPISLSELLCDIYLDLKDFLVLYTKPSTAAKENAIANCRYFFHNGWGMRLALALPYVHWLNCTEEAEDEEDY